MKRFTIVLLALLLLAGCASAPKPAEQAEASPDPAQEAGDDITLVIGRKLALPVTEDSIRDYYQSPDGFHRHVLEIQQGNGGYLVWSADRSRSDDSEAPQSPTRFDFVFSESGNCYALMECQDTVENFGYTDRGGVWLVTDGSSTLGTGFPAYVHAGLGWPLVDLESGQPTWQHDLYCAPEVEAHPLEIPLADGELAALEGDSTVSPLEGVYLSANSLELLFDTSAHAAFPLVEISYDKSNGELTLLCRNTALHGSASGNNLYVEAIRAEQRGADSAVVCDLGLSEETWLASAHANAIQAETEFLPGYDWGRGVLRLTFWPFMG